jgi:succinate dehydrogenase assembly factor 1
MSTRHSGIQKEVLKLYKDCLLAAYKKNKTAVDFVRTQFKDAKAIDRLDFQRIEYLIRNGKKKLQSYSVGTEGFASYVASKK